MSPAAIFVDLPNFYSRLLKSGVADERLLRDYFLYWLDIDQLAMKLTGEACDVWVFYSGRRFGPSGNRIEGDFLKQYVTRLNSMNGVTGRDANIPGEQRETITHECENCHHVGIAQAESEKGIDTSLIVHLFDTIGSWDNAYLLSGDADFVPAVASLRRQGKRVTGAGFADAASSLIRECYGYVDLVNVFLKDDIAGYCLFRPGGIIDSWFTLDLRPNGPRYDTIVAEATWMISGDFGKPSISWYSYQTLIETTDEQKRGTVSLTMSPLADMTSRVDLVDQFAKWFPGFVRPERSDAVAIFEVGPIAWHGIRRHELELKTRIPNVKYESDGLIRSASIKYKLNPKAAIYEAASEG